VSARVLIAGGGPGALEAALALRDAAGERVEVEICAPGRDFVYRPFAIGEPYGASTALRYDLAELARRAGAGFRLAGVEAVDPEARQARTRDGERIPYDHLILAVGARMLEAVPGAVTYWGAVDEPRVHAVVRDLREGRLRRLVFTAPGGVSWVLPLYELALLAVAEAAKAGGEGARITVVTPEEAPLLVFGRRASEEAAAYLAERGVEVVAGTHPVRFQDGALSVAPGEPLAADAVVSLPRLEGRRVEGVPHDADGFVAIDRQCRVRGLERAFAIGDVTSFPIKQGGIATQQADAAAEAIAAELGCPIEPRPFDPVLRAVLWTGGEPRYLYGELSGGRGDTSAMSDSSPWPGSSGKIVGRHLSPFLDAAAKERARSR